jgi:hypothetical protein
LRRGSALSAKGRIGEIELAQVQGLLARIEAAQSPEDYELARALVDAYVELTRLVREKGTTIARLRFLLGFSGSERTADVLARCTPDPAAEGSSDAPGEGGRDPARDAKPGPPDPDAGDPSTSSGEAGSKAKGHGRIAASDYPDAHHIAVPHESLRAGDTCPACAHGKLYPLSEPARLVRIVGQAPLAAICWDCDRMRCGGCGQVYTAQPPNEALGPKHTESAASMMALLRYGCGMPLNRLARLQGNLRIPLPASTQWDVVLERVDALKPAYQELRRQAANGSVVHNDDTYMSILEFMGKRRAELLRRGKLPDPERTGLFTTGVISITENGPIALFLTGRAHAGENLNDLLNDRAPHLEAPIQMSDALARNHPREHKVVEANCLAHGRRHVVDEVEGFPAECRYVLKTLGKVFKNDALCKQQGLSDQGRLRFHQRESAPLMEKLHGWIEEQFAERRIEPNSGLGEALQYLLTHWVKLTLFLRVAGAPLENNICERGLKKAIIHRKNSLFYRTQRGAHVGDLYMTLIHTAELHRQNPFDYLKALQHRHADVARNPGDWLPWNYRATLDRLEHPQAAAA